MIDPNDDFTRDDFMEDQHIDIEHELEYDDDDDDRFADGYALASAGFGTDEDYGFFGED